MHSRLIFVYGARFRSRVIFSPSKCAAVPAPLVEDAVCPPLVALHPCKKLGVFVGLIGGFSVLSVGQTVPLLNYYVCRISVEIREAASSHVISFPKWP